MPSYAVIHYHNVAAGREANFSSWFQERQVAHLVTIPGLGAIQRMMVTETQMMLSCAQSFRFLSLYEIETPDPAPLLIAFHKSAREEAEQAGFLADHQTHVYEFIRPWIYNTSPPPQDAPDYLMLIMGNSTPGMDEEYHHWYDTLHGPEILGTPGITALRRGILAPYQAQPDNEHPGARLVLVRINTYDLLATCNEYRARNAGTSPSGIKWEARSPAGSLHRTVHVFRPVTQRWAARPPRLPANVS